MGILGPSAILSVLPSSGVSAEEWDVRYVKEKWGS